MLEPYRVLDLTDDRGEIAGVILRDLGADVIRVEPPSGSDARRRGPMLDAGDASLRSLQFHAYNRGKRSIALDLGAPADAATFLDLVARADVLIESGQPSALAAAGFGFARLREANAQIVQVRVTPFGSDGPYANYAASDLTLAAMGGPMMVQGEPDRAPLRMTVPQVWRHTGAEAAVATLVALERRRRSGEAQLVDVSAQCVMTWTMLEAMDAFAIQGFDFQRHGPGLDFRTRLVPSIYEAADGYVIFAPRAMSLARLVPWMVADGTVPARWAEGDWSDYHVRAMGGDPMPQELDDVVDALERFFRRYPKADLMARGVDDGVAIAAVNTLADLLELEQLRVRDYWRSASLAGGERVRIPGPFVRLAGGGVASGGEPPALDAHGEEVRQVIAAEAPRPSIGGGDGALPFTGVRVADFSWVGVGPITAKALADHGANVIRVESELRPDVLRGGRPFKDDVPGANRSQFFGDFNTSKRGLALDLTTAEGLAIAKRLIAWADVCLESFAAGKLASLGLGADVLRELNPSLIMVDTCLMGQTGPAASFAGFGFHAAAVAGFHDVTGWPDLPPSGPRTAYTDTICPRFLTATVMAALDRRRRTGEGQSIDAGQLEMALHFLAPEILDYQARGRLPERLGNADPAFAPHGVYACAGDDRWCAIAVESDAQWESLRGALGDPGWARARELAVVAGRLARRADLDAWITEWTCSREAGEVMQTLQAAGVPAGVAMRSSDLLADEHYAARGFYRYLEHPEMGRVPYAGHQFRIAGYESGPRGPAPLLGEHSAEILSEELGLSSEEIEAALIAGAIR